MQNKLKKSKLPIAAIIICLVIIIMKIGIVFSSPEKLLSWYESDDAFYYFKVAQNITEGNGISFDGISRTNGFHPLWLIICTPVFAVARFDLFLPLRFVALISILLNAGTSVLIYKLVKKVIHKEVGFFIALLWAFSPDIHKVTTEQGMESGIAAFFIVLLVFLISKTESKVELRSKDIYIISLVATLALYSRLDNIFLVILMGFWLIFRKSSNLRYLIFIDIFIGFSSVLLGYFGRVGFGSSFLPYSKAALLMVIVVSIFRPLIYYFSGLYHPPKQERKWKIMARWFITISITSGVTYIFMQTFRYLGFIDSFPRTTLIIDWALSLFAVVITRLLFYRYVSVSNMLITNDPSAQLKMEWKEWTAIGFKYFFPLIAALLLFLLWNYAYFGNPMPISGEIKQWWGTMQTVYGKPVNSFEQVFGLPSGLKERPWMLFIAIPFTILFEAFFLLSIHFDSILIADIAGLLALVGLFTILWQIFKNQQDVRKSIKEFALLPIITACFFQIYYYAITNYVHTRNWYWIAEMVCIILLFSILLGSYYRRIHSLKKPVFLIYFTRIFLIVFIFLGFNRSFPLHLTRFREKQENPTLEDINSLELYVEKEAVIGMTGGGITAYFLQNRTVVNLDGLMNSVEYFDDLKICDLDEYLKNTGMTYVFGNEYVFTESLPYKCVFEGHLKKIAQLNEGTLFHFSLSEDQE